MSSLVLKCAVLAQKLLSDGSIDDRSLSRISDCVGSTESIVLSYPVFHALEAVHRADRAAVGCGQELSLLLLRVSTPDPPFSRLYECTADEAVMVRLSAASPRRPHSQDQSSPLDMYNNLWRWDGPYIHENGPRIALKAYFFAQLTGEDKIAAGFRSVLESKLEVPIVKAAVIHVDGDALIAERKWDVACTSFSHLPATGSQLDVLTDFRMGLCRLREGNVDSAISAFSRVSRETESEDGLLRLRAAADALAEQLGSKSDP